MKSLMNEYKITHRRVIRAINSAMTITNEGVLRVTRSGLCTLFSAGDVYEVLEELGGKPRSAYFWRQPSGHMDQAADQRLMMLAFLYEWTR